MMDLVEIEPVQLQLSFDYDSLDSDIREQVRDLIGQGHLHLRRTKEEIIAFGKVLHKVKKLVPHGQFRALTTAEYGLPDSTLTYAMKKASDSENANISILPENAVEPPVEPVQEVEEPRLKRTTNEDKRQTVLNFIAETPDWQEMRNTAIARMCGVSESLVRTIRAELESEPETIEVDIPTSLDFYHERDESEVEPVQTVVESTAHVDNMSTDVDNAPISEPETVQELEYVPDEYPPSFPDPWSDDTTSHVEEEEEEISQPVAKSASLTVLQSSESNEWYTPKRYIDAVHELMGKIEVDPASCEEANRIVKAEKFYTIDDSGLNYDWSGKVWLNPPYGRDGGESNQEIWSKRLVDQYKDGITTEAVLLVNAVPGNKWFQPLWEYLICFVDHRIHFYSAETEQSQPTHSNALIYLGHQRKRFIEIFSRFGTVIERAR